MYDLLIKNARIVDGSGAPSFHGSVAVQGGTIAGVGDIDGSARRVIDADGLAVSPGFIDLHTHYDAQLMWDPLATSSCWHGITTILMGNCGFTLAPCKPTATDRDYLMGILARVEGIRMDVLNKGLGWEWSTFPQYLDRVGRSLGVNVMAQIGHSAVRYNVMGGDAYEREAKPDEVARMQALVREAMAAGAWGFSTSRQIFDYAMNGKPVPSRLASDAELMALGCVLKEFGRGILAYNPKNDGTMQTPDNWPFFAAISKASGRPVVWNALFYKPERPHGYRDILNAMEDANWQGGRVYAMGSCRSIDFDFSFTYTILFQHFSKFGNVVETPDLAERRRLLGDPSLRPALRQEFDYLVATTLPRRDLKTVVVREASLPKNKRLEGRYIAEIAAEQHKHPFDAMLDLAVEENLATGFAYEGILNADDDAVTEILRHPQTIVGVSDAGAHLEFDPGTDYSTVLLSKWVRERKRLTLEDAVRRLSHMPALVMGLTDRGLIAAGKAADIVVFDPDTVAPCAREKVFDLPGNNPRMYHKAQGIHYTVVNGQVLLEHGVHTGATPGALLRSGDYSTS
ncbi:MAG: amidohydrolase family protein [Chloroflexi bacterium]|nr:amidohydrolase family protein [Chloroflexota bacterium]